MKVPIKIDSLVHVTNLCMCSPLQWDSEKLLERWADDAKSLCTKTGVEMPRDEDVKTQRNALAKVAPGECSVCGDDNDKIATLTCGHGLCGGKWAVAFYSNLEK